MVRLLFTFNREPMQFVILKREIFYADRVWSNWIRVVPKDEQLMKRMIMSRNRIPKSVINLFNLTKEELDEYASAKDDNELAEIVISDARGKGCKLEGRFEDETSQNKS